MARLSRGQRAGAGTTALLVMALLSLVLLLMLILGLVAVPAVPRRFEDDTSGAVVELKLPSHQHWWVYWAFHPFPSSLFSLFTNYILKSSDILCSHFCSVCTFHGRNC